MFEHICRLNDVSKFEGLSKKVLADGVTAIYGAIADTIELQSIRFDVAKFDKYQADAWLVENKIDGKVQEPIQKQFKLLVISKLSWGVELGYALDTAKAREGDNIHPFGLCKTSLPLAIGDVVTVRPTKVNLLKVANKFAIEGDAQVIEKSSGKPSSSREIIQESIEIIEKTELRDEAVSILKLKQSMPAPLLNTVGTVTKSNQIILNKSFPIIKKDEDRQIVYGVVYEPFDGSNLDAHGDYATEIEIEKAAHQFLESFNEISLMHEKRINQDAKTSESFIAPCDYTMGTERIKKGSWVMATHIINKDLWQAVLKGDIDAYSIEGVGMAGEDLLKSEKGKLTKRNLVNMVLDAVALVDKGANKKRFYLKKKDDTMDEAMLNTIVEAVLARINEKKPEEKPEEVAPKKEEEVKKEAPKEEEAKAIIKDAAYYIANPTEDIPDELISEVISNINIKD